MAFCVKHSVVNFHSSGMGNGSTRVNADRKAKGQPLHTVVHSSEGMEWPFGEAVK